MTLTLANPTSNSYTYNACSRILERESGGAWTLVQEQRMCTMIAHLLGPRSNRTEITELSGGLEPGRYRVVIALTEEAPGTAPQSTRATSAPFTVGG